MVLPQGLHPMQSLLSKNLLMTVACKNANVLTVTLTKSPFVDMCILPRQRSGGSKVIFEPVSDQLSAFASSISSGWKVLYAFRLLESIVQQACHFCRSSLFLNHVVEAA